MKRVMIIGQPGAGKSWLARELGRVTGLPVVHIDHIHWKSGWVERTKDEKTQMVREVHARKEWIFEGGHSRTWGERLSRADTLIWLDFPLLLRSWRVIRRTVMHYGQTRPDLPDGCPEQFSFEFYQWIWNTRNSGRQNAQRVFERAEGVEKLRLTSRLEMSAYIEKVEKRFTVSKPVTP